MKTICHQRWRWNESFWIWDGMHVENSFQMTKCVPFPLSIRLYIHLSRINTINWSTMPRYCDTTFLLKLSFYISNAHRNTQNTTSVCTSVTQITILKLDYYASMNHKIWRELWKLIKIGLILLMYCKFSYLVSQPLYEIDININRIRNRLIYKMKLSPKMCNNHATWNESITSSELFSRRILCKMIWK